MTAITLRLRRRNAGAQLVEEVALEAQNLAEVRTRRDARNVSNALPMRPLKPRVVVIDLAPGTRADQYPTDVPRPQHVDDLLIGGPGQVGDIVIFAQELTIKRPDLRVDEQKLGHP